MTFCFGHWLSAQATSDPTWQSGEAKLQPIQLVTQNQPGPFRCFRWAEPINSAFLIYIFLLIFSSYMGLAQQFGLLFSRAWPFCRSIDFLFSAILFCSWSHHRLVLLVMLIPKLVPHIKNFELCQTTIISWTPLSGFHFTGIQTTYTIIIRPESNRNSSKTTIHQSITIITVYYKPDMPTTACNYNT